MKPKRYSDRATEYAKSVCSGEITAGEDRILACQRFLKDRERDDLEYKTHDADIVCALMEGLFVHYKGEDLDGYPLMGKPFKLNDWECFVIYNILGFYIKGTNVRRYKEATIFGPRKIGKTSFTAALAFAIAILQRKSNAQAYIVGAETKQAQQSMEFLEYSLKKRGIYDEFTVKNNSFERSILYEFKDEYGIPEGQIKLQVLASTSENDSFNCNLAIADEVGAFKTSKQYNRFLEAMQSYQNRLMIGISTAGDDANSFWADKVEYARKVLNGTVTDDTLFAFLCSADQAEDGSVDFTSDEQFLKANPGIGTTTTLEYYRQWAQKAQTSSRERKDFFTRGLNVFVNSLRAYFDIAEFKASDEKYDWTLEELVKLPITWYGGADLSKLHDLTAAALFGHYENAEDPRCPEGGVDIIISHAFIPLLMAREMASKDRVPFFAWEDKGWCTLSPTKVTNMAEIVGWFEQMRDMGFNIKEIGHDRKFAGDEFYPLLKEKKFNIVEQPQLYWLKSQGFRYIERSAKNGSLYYVHNEAYELCVSNVSGVEKQDDLIQYSKVRDSDKIDLFDASVFAVVRYLDDITKRKEKQDKDDKAKRWFN